MYAGDQNKTPARIWNRGKQDIIVVKIRQNCKPFRNPSFQAVHREKRIRIYTN